MTSSDAPAEITYAEAGVDTQAGDRAVELMKDAVAATHGSNVLSGAGGFAGMVDASALRDYRHPLLASSTDGVGTKVAIAQALDIHDTVGQDLVAMVVDDIVVTGAKPLLMTDYIACGKVVPSRIADIVRGIALGCQMAEVPLVGGETAEHPGLMAEDEYDIAGAATGVVEADSVLGPQRVQAGDVLVAMASSGLHSNGYSLVRRVVEVAGWGLERQVDELGCTLGEELLKPTAIYSSICLNLIEALGVGEDGVHAFAHVTGGGLGANLSRVIPQGLSAMVDRDSWRIPPVFDMVRKLGNVPWADLEATLNLGVGMVAVIGQGQVEEALQQLRVSGVDAWVLGAVVIDLGEHESSVGGNARRIQGAKGVEAGAVILEGAYLT